jgi:hypothetical protein
VTVTATNRSDEVEDDFEPTTFFAQTTNLFGQKLTGSLISDLLPTTMPTFSASCFSTLLTPRVIPIPLPK